MNIKCTHTHTCTWYSTRSLTQKHTPDDQYEERRVLYPALFVWNWETKESEYLIHHTKTDDSKPRPEVWFYILSVWKEMFSKSSLLNVKPQRTDQFNCHFTEVNKTPVLRGFKTCLYCIKMTVLIMLENWNDLITYWIFCSVCVCVYYICTFSPCYISLKSFRVHGFGFFPALPSKRLFWAKRLDCFMAATNARVKLSEMVLLLGDMNLRDSTINECVTIDLDQVCFNSQSHYSLNVIEFLLCNSQSLFADTHRKEWEVPQNWILPVALETLKIDSFKMDV